MDLTAQTQSLTSHPDGTEVQVEVAGPRGIPKNARKLRARARALISSGVLATGRDSIEQLTVGEIQRFTRIEGQPITEEAGTLLRSELYTVIVSRD